MQLSIEEKPLKRYNGLLQTYTETTPPRSLFSYLTAGGVRVILLLVGSFLLVVWFSSIVPYNMDEFIHYNTIICYAFPGNNLDGRCDPFALNFLNLGWMLPLRAYHYAGSFPALYFLPLHHLWNSPLLARLLGFWFLSAGAFIVARVFHLRLRYVLISMALLFPYLFQHLVDTGPIGFHILSVYILYVVFERWCRTQHWKYAFLKALIIFLGMWTKLAYVWLLPGIGLLFLVHAGRHRDILLQRKNLQRMGLQICCSLGLVWILLSTLLLSSAADNDHVYPYLDQVRMSESYTLTEMVQGAWRDDAVVRAFLHPLEATQRVYEVSAPIFISNLYAIVLYAFVPACVFALFVLKRKGKWSHLLVPLVLYGSFIATVFMIVRTKASWSMHHAILSYPFLLLAIAATIRCMLQEGLLTSMRGARVFASISVFFLLLNVHFFLTFAEQPFHASEHPSKEVIHAVLQQPEVSKRYIAVIVDWGMYYYQGLFGQEDQNVLFWWGMRNEDQVDRLKEFAASTGRRVLFVFTSHTTSANLDLLRASFNLHRCDAVPEEAIWQIMGEEDSSLQHACAHFASSFGKEPLPLPRLRASLIF